MKHLILYKAKILIWFCHSFKVPFDNTGHIVFYHIFVTAISLSFVFDSYEELMKEENILNQEITTLEKRLESWAQAPPITIETKTTGKTKPVSSARSVVADLPPDVAAFEVFVDLYIKVVVRLVSCNSSHMISLTE